MFGEKNWTAFHKTHSSGKSIVYCRGSGATVKNLKPGDIVIFVRSGDSPHYIHMWGQFSWFNIEPIDSAWEKFGTALGAEDKQNWSELVSRLPALTGRESFGAIVVDNLVVPVDPIPLASVDVATRNATKGRFLNESEVLRILGAMEQTLPTNKEGYTPNDSDSREIVNRQMLARLGQPMFRSMALLRYNNTCVISACTISELLESAHICPHRGEKDNHPENSLLLRCDLHTLFDRDLLGINPNHLTVELHPTIRQSEYQQYSGVRLLVTDSTIPSRDALKRRWDIFRNHANG